MEYIVNTAIMITIQAIAVCGLNIIVGYAGQISLGHAAFYGIGAYDKSGIFFLGSSSLGVAYCCVSWFYSWITQPESKS